MSNRKKIAVFISGSGSNMQALIDASKSGLLTADIVWVVSNMRKAFGLKRAEKEQIESFVYKKKSYDSPQIAGDDLLQKLQERHIDYIALAGYLQLLPEVIVKEFKGRILNIHPALLPKYGGKGMYGQHVHKAVLESGDSESGATAHLADEIYDNGKILEQFKVPVLESDTPETLAARVLEQEHKLFPRALQELIKGKYEINDG